MERVRLTRKIAAMVDAPRPVGRKGEPARITGLSALEPVPPLVVAGVPRRLNGRIVTNQRKRQQMLDILTHLMDRTLQEGFFGTALLSCQIQDGVIQSIGESIEQKYR